MSKGKKVPTCDRFKLSLINAVNAAIYDASDMNGVESNQPTSLNYTDLSFTEMRLIHIVYEAKKAELNKYFKSKK